MTYFDATLVREVFYISKRRENHTFSFTAGRMITGLVFQVLGWLLCFVDWKLRLPPARLDQSFSDKTNKNTRRTTSAG
ncbi:hypothetical protein GS627_12165 [Ruegeria sp. HKCCD7318]|uniref:hypothetical protein n=1 Tax=Ruegeria sp. HKCCD7319 TaxID=2683015 RepID=UPI001490E6D2|nr:hypothetical protein [Ruegeria sp. HKCCD7319]NOD35701.1 hypothetical protein [Ruegeria sp. HKCCD7296]NOE34493.1 hypothetical protein [Ruegeria sp. HKCCD7318]